MPMLVSCPHCNKSLRVPDNLLGQTVKCPGCQNAFATTSDESASASSEPSRRPVTEASVSDRPRRRQADEEQPRRRSKEDDYDDVEDERSRQPDIEEDFDDEDDRRQRRGRKRRRAKEAVTAPGIALIVVGALGTFVALANLGLILAGFGFNAGGQNAPGFQTSYFIGAIVPVFWGIVVTAGGFSLMRLKARGSAMTAAIVALVPCNLCWPVGLPIGIWALIVMGKPDVKSCFR